MAEGSFVPLFMGNDGTGPYAVSGQAGNGPLPVTFGAPPTGLDVNSTTQFKGADGLIYDVKAATSGDGPLPVILANALGPLNTDSLTQFHGTDGVIYTVKGAPGDGPLPVQLAAGGAPAPVHIDPSQLPLPVHLDPTSLPVPITLPGSPATYVMTFGITPAVITDLAYASLAGSATKTVKILRIALTSYADPPDSITYTISTSKTASAGGTVGVPLPMDSTNAAATASALSYSVGVVPPADSRLVEFPIAVTASNSVIGTEYNWRPPEGGQALTLHGVAEFLYIRYATRVAAAGILHISIYFTEE